MNQYFDRSRTTAAIAESLGVRETQVQNAVQLLDDGNTLPFIARYRKEATSGLDELQLRQIQDLLSKARELADRKKTILKTVEDLGQLTPAFRQQILDCDDRQHLELLYLPFKPKRKTKASVARERGLQPLADILIAQRRLSVRPAELLARFVSPEKDVPDASAALAGACDIVAETWADDPDLRQWMLERAQRGQLTSSVKRGKKAEGTTFEMYDDHRERVDRVPSHRFLAMKRGEAEGILRVSVELDEDYVLPRLHNRLLRNREFEFADALSATVQDCYKRLLQPAAESSVLQELKTQADEQSIAVFVSNMRELLLAPPAGAQVTIGIDPGFRTGCKVAVVDQSGKFLDHATIFPTPPRSDTKGAGETLLMLIKKHHAELIAIGNGTASRETDSFVTKLIRDHDLQVTKVMVSEAGASVYSASELAGREYPELDLTVRGAISIAHRLQDPLAELVKIDPKAVGVGQYQHDVNQSRLQLSLDREVESCVSSVGVDVNMASASLLSYVPGIGPAVASNIVQFRDSHGAFLERRELLKVPKLGAKAFEQCAGFLRIRDGRQPLDNSAVHPESYAVVNRMAQQLDVPPAQLVGNSELAGRLNVNEFAQDGIGEFTVRDILQELARPGRDPRAEFTTVQFAEGVEDISDLAPGMKLEGAVTNVTHFGAFVDIGVHHDGLIHISQLADHFVKDPAQEVKVGDIVQVTVLEVDQQRKRISLSRKQNG